MEHHISHYTANKLLEILRKHGNTNLPRDVRSLVDTPRNASVKITVIGNGHYAHFGFLSVLERSIKLYFDFIKSDKIKLNINVDGLPISKSSGSQFWPILASIEGIHIYTSPFIIGVYHGMSKPSDFLWIL